MQFGEVLPEDAPDPRLDQYEKLRSMPVPVVGLVPQASIEEAGAGVGSGGDASGPFEMYASISYLLWRNPANKSDPANLAELDERTRASIQDVPPWPRPKWLIEHVEKMKYPQLWEAVRTTWHRDPSGYTTLSAILTQHVNYILNKVYRLQRGREGNPWDGPPAEGITERNIRRGVPVRVDGLEVSGSDVDTDPFVYGVGAELPSGGVLTAVIPREELDHIQISFSRRP